MRYSSLRKYISLLLREKAKKKDRLLGEPDLTNKEQRKNKNKEKEKDEMSVAAGMPGVSTPLGTGPTYPAKIIKKNKKRQKKK
tara:strand:- start:166 stop:414 length:249 start_codon:yes stop_codon:yes gene_type:complete